jgi:hypothetical protein
MDSSDTSAARNDRNKEPIRPRLFSQETMDALIAIGKIIERANRRMKQQGYDIVNGVIVNMTTGEPYDPKEANRIQYFQDN